MKRCHVSGKEKISRIIWMWLSEFSESCSYIFFCRGVQEGLAGGSGARTPKLAEMSINGRHEGILARNSSWNSTSQNRVGLSSGLEHESCVEDVDFPVETFIQIEQGSLLVSMTRALAYQQQCVQDTPLSMEELAEKTAVIENLKDALKSVLHI